MIAHSRQIAPALQKGRERAAVRQIDTYPDDGGLP